MSTDLLSQDIQKSCQTIINQVRWSCLNFSLQETPFSLYVTIRKSYSKSQSISYAPALDQIQPEVLPASATNDSNFSSLQSRCKFLEQSNDNLKKEYADAISEIEENHETINNLRKQVELFQTQNDEIVGKRIKAFNDEKRSLQLKHEKTCSENKTLKREKDDLEKEINKLSIALKTSRKEIKEQSHQYEKKVEVLKANLEDLVEYKTQKVMNEKDLNLN